MKLVLSLETGIATSITRDRPSEADIESSAARARPLFLENDPVHWDKTVKALGGLAMAAPQEHRDFIKRLGKVWLRHDTNTRWFIGASTGDFPPIDELRTDREIARDFIYGDLVHADPEARRRLKLIPEDDRLLAATVWVADAIRLTLLTKRAIIDLQAAGALAPRPSS